MKKSNKKFDILIESYGLYTRWNKKSRDLPEIVKFTNEIVAESENEFGMILRIKKGKGIKLQYKISHPPFKDLNGKMTPDFTGEQIVSSNDYYFFIGDCIWEPIADKKGSWKIEIFHKGLLLLSKVFIVQ